MCPPGSSKKSQVSERKLGKFFHFPRNFHNARCAQSLKQWESFWRLQQVCLDVALIVPSTHLRGVRFIAIFPSAAQPLLQELCRAPGLHHSAGEAFIKCNVDSLDPFTRLCFTSN